MIPKPSPISDESSAETRLRVLFITEESATQVTPGKPEKVMPAENLYKGSFLEVRLFLDELRTLGEVKLLILSSSKGVVSGEDMFLAYTVAPASPIPSQTAIKALARAIRKANDEGVVVIVALSHRYLRWVIEPRAGVGLLTSLVDSRLAMVTGGQMGERLSVYAQTHGCPWLILHRVGVARVGQKNRQAILRWLLDESKSTIVTE